MKKKISKHWIYYLGFPILVFSLCLFSFYLGWTRAKHVSLDQRLLPKYYQVATGNAVSELTYYDVLRNTRGDNHFTDDVIQSRFQGRQKAYSVQVSAFQDAGKAHELVDKLKVEGWRAFVRSNRTKGWYKVSVGLFQTKRDAKKKQAELIKAGFKKGFIVEIEK